MRHRIVAIAIGLLVSTGAIAPKATAQELPLQAAIGVCNSILAEGAQYIGQINADVNLDQSCDGLIGVVVDFYVTGCTNLPPDLLWLDKLQAESLDRICTAFDTCAIPAGGQPDVCLP